MKKINSRRRKDKDEIPATLEYQQREGTDGYDCYKVIVKEAFVGYLYLLSKAEILPTKLLLEDELVVHTAY